MNIYAICIRTAIDGGAPGYYAVAMCETEEDAVVIKEFVDSCIKTINSTPWNIRRHKDAEMLIDDVADWIGVKFGYSEGIDSNVSYIKKIKIVETGNGRGLPTKLNHCLRDYYRKKKERANVI